MEGEQSHDDPPPTPGVAVREGRGGDGPATGGPHDPAMPSRLGPVSDPTDARADEEERARHHGEHRDGESDGEAAPGGEDPMQGDSPSG